MQQEKIMALELFVVTALIVIDLGDQTLRTKKNTTPKSNNSSFCLEINVKFSDSIAYGSRAKGFEVSIFPELSGLKWFYLSKQC